MRRGTMTVLSLAATAALVTACGTDGGDDPTDDATTDATTSAEPTTDPTTDPTTEEPTGEETTSASPDDAEGPPFPTDTTDQVEESFDATLLLVDVRVAEHEGFDRFVLEFEGDGEPGWRIAYVEEAVRDGSGEPIDLDSDALLQVVATHTMPDDMTGYYDGPREIDPDGEVIDEVYLDGTFEGYTTAYLGLDDVEVFRVFALTEPSRLVVDVADSD